MLTTLAVLMTLGFGPGDAGQLKLTNVRTTHGALGPTRPDNKILPGDLVCLSFDIEGMQVNPKGKVLYAIGMEISDSNGKALFKQAPQDLEADGPAQGKGVPACAKVQVGIDTRPGDYTVKVTVTDRAGHTSQEVSRSYQVLEKAFGLVRISLTSDPEADAALAALQAGKPAWIKFNIVGFGRDKEKNQPSVQLEMRVLNDQGESILAKPTTGAINGKDVPEKSQAIPTQIMVVLHDEGKFTVELKATDQVSGDTAKVTFPIRVTKSK
jgi:hypothetical protein